MNSIKDLIYFDYDKAKSLSSQLSGGLINDITKAIENEGGLNSDIGFDIKLLKGKIGGSDKERSIRTERIELYHELLNEVENKLTKKEILKDLNSSFGQDAKTFDDFMEIIPDFTFIKASGWSTFEDFERFKKIMSNFNEVQRLIYTSQLENNPEIIALKKEINDLKKGLQKSNNHKELAKLKAYEKKFDQAIEELSDAKLLDETFIERIKTFLDTFTPNRLNFRLAPLDDFPDFQILANLKSKYLVNGDFENVIYTYGTRPNIKLSIFGVITSCPQKEDKRVNLNDEYLEYSDDQLSEVEVYDKVFRNVFSSFEDFEKFFFVPSYPKIAISPIGIYREISYE
ncbi:MAG: hypothetical protein ABGW88_02135 [Leeuwenhoekiella sp.]|mgnify:CR=1 FL=1|uniref:DUF6414 family protein n=1 Tax=Leeuwenhoekiella sp. TaxID=1977054 RepID=UPI003241BA68|tara:strand:- start:403 stop:1431 length:1029 start_codon:yes stop_codon:yes gene_type:complete